MEEEDKITFPTWKVVDEYWDPVESTSLSDNFAAVFMEVEILLNSCVEQTVILNGITEDNNKILVDKSNKTVKFHRLASSMDKAMYTFQSVVDADQQNG